jgi:hypothetical protein
MLAKTPIEHRFYLWVAAQPPDQTYYWRDADKCACGLFLKDEFGFDHDTILQTITLGSIEHHWRSPERRDCMKIWDRFNFIARGDSDHTEWTFGKLTKRIEEKMPEYVNG